MTMLRYRNRGTQAAVSAKAENTENTRQSRRQGCSSGFFAAFSFEFLRELASSGHCRRLDIIDGDRY